MNFKLPKLFFIFSLLVLAPSILAKKPKRLAAGDPAPLFDSRALFPDGSIGEFHLKDYIGKDLVLYFYPFDSTPTCSKQARSFTAAHEKLQKAGISVIGVSCDSPYAHQRFAKRLDIEFPFPLVSDTHLKREISMKYNAVGWFFYSKRKTFLIDKGGIVFKIFDKVDVDYQIEDILKCFAEYRQNKY